MSTAEVIEQALKLKASERLALVEMLQESLDKSDPEIDRIWLEEAQRRLQAYREGKLAAIPMEAVFRDL
jgi:putative addiction module component (TIGR02574 family)